MFTSRKNNQQLENAYERATTNCSHGFGGFCGTCMYCAQPRDLDKLEDLTVAYCTLSRKEEKQENNDNGAACEGCRGSFRCANPNSPCFTYFCGEYPGTGPRK